MLPGKRIRKMPIQFEPAFPTKKNKQENACHGTPKLIRCDYEIMSTPFKYEAVCDILPLCGNIPLIQRDNDFLIDFSLLNDFHVFRDVQVTLQEDGQKLISVITARKKEARFPRWKIAIRKMVKVKNPRIRRWGRAIRDFSIAYENAINKYIGQQTQLIENEKSKSSKYLDVKKEIKEEEYSTPKSPFIQLKSSFRGHENHLVEVILNESLLDILGYTIDSFVTVVFKEGLPPIFQLLSTTNSNSIQEILEDYAATNFTNHHTPDFNSTLLKKDGHVINARVGVHFSMNAEDDKYGSDTTFIFSEHEPSYSPSLKAEWEPNIGENFLTNINIKKEENEQFLRAHYDHLAISRLSSFQNAGDVEDSQEDYKLEEI